MQAILRDFFSDILVTQAKVNDKAQERTLCLVADLRGETTLFPCRLQ